MMKRFATLTLIALMLGAAPAVFGQGSGGSGGGGSGSGGSSSGGSGAGGSGGGGRSDGIGNTPGSPGIGAQPPASGATEGSPGRGSGQVSPDTSPGTTGGTRTARPIDNTAQATTALQSQGYSNVQGLVRSGDVYRGRAVRDGRTVMIEVDARTGTVRETRG